MVTNNKQEDEGTAIRVSKDVYIWLESKKIHHRQSFSEVLDYMRLDEQGK